MKRFQFGEPGLTYTELALKTAAWSTVIEIFVSHPVLGVWLVLAGGKRLNGIEDEARKTVNALVSLGLVDDRGDADTLHITGLGTRRLQTAGL